MLHISLAAEKIGSIFGFPITNSLFVTWIIMGFLALLSLVITRDLAIRPSKFQVVVEIMIGGFYDFFKKITGKKIDTYYPLLATIFFFVIFSNWIGLLPGVGSIGFRKSHKIEIEAVQQETSEEIHAESEGEEVIAKESFTPLLRAPTADLNTTLALALISVLSIQYFGFASLGVGYLKKFINLKNPIMLFVGILEIISEFAKIVSFGFRLFGNIFAGEVLLAVVAFLMPFIVPIPFLGLEIFVGFIQALVFAMLTAVFLNMATHEH